MYTKKGEWKFPQDIYLDERITEDVRRLYSSGSAEKRYKNYNDILSKWLGLKINGYSLATYFIEKKINEIYIYGTADIAGHLYDDVHEEITIKAFIVEAKTMKTFRGLEVYDMGDDVELDGIPIIITPTHANGVIQYVFERNKVINPIIPINDIVDYVSEKYER